MKIVLTIIGLIFLGSVAYYGYNSSLEESANVPIKKSSDEVSSNVAVLEDEPKDVKIESDIAVKASIEENIPSEDTEDIIENEEASNKELPDNINELIEDQEALLHDITKQQPEIDIDRSVPDEGAAARLADKDKMLKRDASIAARKAKETEEEKIIREEEAKNKAAIAEDNVIE